MSNSPKTRASLILRLRHPDDGAAWSEFVEIYQPLVYRIARSKGLQEADSLDLTQDVLAKVAKAINRFDPDPNQGSFRGWISRITRNLVVEFMRSKNRRWLTGDNTSIQQILDMTPAGGPESERFDAERERQVFAWAAEKIRSDFQPATWQAFWKTAVENESVADVATQLNLSAGAIYIARSRVMARLKEKVKLHDRQSEHSFQRGQS